MTDYDDLADMDARIREHGARPKFLDAVRAGDIGKARNLISNYGETLINSKDSSDNTPLILAAMAGNTEMADFLLIKTNASRNSQNADGDTALMIAVKNDNFEIAERILSSNALTDLTNNDGKTALQMAEAKGHTKIADLIRQHVGGDKIGDKPTPPRPGAAIPGKQPAQGKTPPPLKQ